MQHKQMVEIPATKREVTVKVTCDFCNAEIKEIPHEPDDINISRRSGSSWPSGGYGGTEEVDMCGNCFDTKLKPWVASQGVTFRKTDWDY
jgi:hypothetical protein